MPTCDRASPRLAAALREGSPPSRPATVSSPGATVVVAGVRTILPDRMLETVNYDKHAGQKTFADPCKTFHITCVLSSRWTPTNSVAEAQRGVMTHPKAHG